MAEPFNYSVGGPNPLDAMQRGMVVGQGLRAGEQNMELARAEDARAQAMADQSMALAGSQEARAQAEFDQAQAQQAAAEQAALAYQSSAVNLGQKFADGTVTYDDVAEHMAAFPEQADEIKKLWDGMSEERKKADSSEIFKGIAAAKAGRPDITAKLLKDRAQAARNAGDQAEADTADAIAALFLAGPEGVAAGMTALSQMLAAVDPEAAKGILGTVEWRAATPEEAQQRGAVAGQINNNTGEFKAETPPAPAKPGDKWRPATPEEAKLRGAAAGQINDADGEFKATPKSQTMTFSSDGKGGTTLVMGEDGGVTNNKGYSPLNLDPRDFDVVTSAIDEIRKDENLAKVTGPWEGGGGNDVENMSALRRSYYGSGGLALIERISQLQATTWLSARDMLRGAGAITDYESKKAEAAMSRLSRVKNDKDFKEALDDLEFWIRQGKAKIEAAAAAGLLPSSGVPQTNGSQSGQNTTSSGVTWSIE